MEEKSNLRRREEIADQYKWKITDLYANDEQWRIEYDKVKEAAQAVKECQGKLLESPKQLLYYFEKNEQMSKLFERVYVYANQRYHEDTTNAIYQELSDLSANLMVIVSSSESYVEAELLGLEKEQLDKFMKEEPGLALYQRYLENILRKKEHILSKQEERILAEVSEVASASSNVFSMMNNADLEFPFVKDEDGNEVQITHARYGTLLHSEDRRVRRETFEALYRVYRQFKNTIAALYNTNLKKDVFYSRIRNYKSSLDMALCDSNIPKSVYDNLIQAVHDEIPTLNQYLKLRKRVLGLSELHMYDLYTPMVPAVDMEIEFEEAKTIVKNAMRPLGEEYLSILEEGYENGWIDVYENVGKRSGAYSWGAYGTHPYVLLNYQNNLNNVFTLAHEMGHAIHSYYSDHTQPYIYAGYKIFVAEVASTCNEALLIHYMLEHSKDKKEKAYLVNYFLEQFRTTLFRQTMFAEFEKLAHEKVEAGEAFTADKFCEMYRGLNDLYYGGETIIDSEIDMEWARIPHFYNSFYVYQYATGFSAAIAISTKILNGEKDAVENYKKFLSGGSSMDPIDLLKLCGVDMTSKEPVEQALQVFKQYVDKLEQML